MLKKIEIAGGVRGVKRFHVGRLQKGNGCITSAHIGLDLCN